LYAFAFSQPRKVAGGVRSACFGLIDGKGNAFDWRHNIHNMDSFPAERNVYPALGGRRSRHWFGHECRQRSRSRTVRAF
jgi:hypothetical protein